MPRSAAEIPAPHGFSVVLQIPGTRQLLAGAVLGRIPLGMISLGILLLVHERYGSFVVAGLAVAGLAIASALSAPVQGALVDRRGPRRILPRVAVAQWAASVAVVAVAEARLPPAALVAATIALGMCFPTISATLRSTWMNTIDSGAVRDSAFTLDATITQLVFATGPLITAAIVELAGPATAVLVAGAFTLAGTLLFVTAPLVAAGGNRGAEHSRPPVGANSVRWIPALANPGLPAVLLTVLLMGCSTGSVEIGLPALAVHLGSRSDAGVFIGFWALGAAGGGWFYGRRTWRTGLRTRQAIAAGTLAALTLPLLSADSVPAALVLSFIAGLPLAALSACQYRLVGDLASERAVTEAFTWNVAALVAGGAIGSALAGVLASGAGPSACFIFAAATAASIVVVIQLLEARAGR